MRYRHVPREEQDIYGIHLNQLLIAEPEAMGSCINGWNLCCGPGGSSTYTKEEM